MVHSHLVRWGFCNIPTQVTMPFAAKEANNETRMYASQYARSKLWIMEYEVNCARYGCVFVESKRADIYTGPKSPKWSFYLRQANPDPLWMGKRKGSLINPADVVSAGINVAEGKLYFGRSSLCGTKPCKVTTKKADGQLVVDCWKTASGEVLSRGELLKDTGHEFVRTKNGDPVPPNAVIAGVSDSDGTLYLGRVGGNIPCAVSAESDRIKYFCFYTDGVKQVESGEIVVLTK